MISNLRARLPPGLGGSDRGAHLVPVTQVLWRGVVRYPRHTDRMRQDVAHCSGLLAVGPELGPKVYDRSVVAEQPLLDEHVRHSGGRALADRVAIERRVRLDETPGLRVGNASNSVGHLLAIPVYGDLQSPLRPRFNQLVDRLLYLILNLGHDPTPHQGYL